jgi:hypothetical protein
MFPVLPCKGRLDAVRRWRALEPEAFRQEIFIKKAPKWQIMRGLEPYDPIDFLVNK